MKKEEPTSKLKFYPTENVAVIKVKRNKKGHRYAITTHGRAVRFKNEPADGEFMKQWFVIADYPCVYLQDGDRRYNALVHRLVAQHFLPKPDRDRVFVIHKDRNNGNNHVSNLKWANKAEHLAHAMAGDAWKKARGRTGNVKLNETRVRLIRKKLAEGKTRMKLIAKQFGISEMQLYRIKSGQNWGWVK